MPRISTDNYDTVASWNGSQDLFIVEQPDGTKVATPAMVKQFIEAGDFVATGEVKDGHGNKLADMAKADEVKGLAEAGDFEATGEVKDGHGNILKDMAKSADVNTALGNKQNVIDQVNFVDCSINWPSTGTDAEKVSSIATQVLSNITTTKAFTMICIKDGGTTLGEMIYGQVSAGNYGVGIFMSYYISGFYRVKNVNRTVTVVRLAEG